MIKNKKQINNKVRLKPKYIIILVIILLSLWIIPSPATKYWGTYNFLQNFSLFLPTIILLLVGKVFTIPLRKSIKPSIRRIIFWVLYVILFLMFWCIQNQTVEQAEIEKYNHGLQSTPDIESIRKLNSDAKEVLQYLEDRKKASEYIKQEQELRELQNIGHLEMPERLETFSLPSIPALEDK